MGHFDGDHGRHDFEHFTAKDDSEENSDDDPVKILYNWKSSAAVLFLTLLKSLQVVKSSF